MRKGHLLLLTVSCLSMLGMGTSLAQAKKEVVKLNFWAHWLSAQRRPTIDKIINNWNAKNPNIQVEYTGIPFDQIINKTLAGVAAGNPPDVVVIDIRTSRFRAAKNQITDLSALGADKSANLFFPNLYATGTYKGKQYALPFVTDTRMLFYNKKAFKEVGLDPNKAPKTWDDLWNYSNKLDKKDGDRYTRMGFHPNFGDYGYTGWVGNLQDTLFDKEFEDPRVNNANAVKALEFMKKWTDRYGSQNYSSFKASFGGAGQDEFMSGKVAMVVKNGNYITTLQRNAPDMEWGMVAVPTPNGKPGNMTSWGGGFNLEIPRGTKHPKEAYAFARYLATEGAKIWAVEQNDLPASRTAQTANTNPLFKKLVGNMKYTFVMPAPVYAPTYETAVNKAVDDVILRGRSPKEALDEAQKTVEKIVQEGKRDFNK
ncbi:ABC transporter substrate-binding protein [Deinococcus cellulosilyticus]|uniref:ABC transporter substrate-binding protein n=1 Tax=Deinococcus cellulosilyticus (strain DSM 18568 / NBRC 106333 / KACC 11606 / 5516J-15) TaxID=1223518 RepID=A0A511N1L8_DEIC1|nr:ABC transporter substrate-binding protein [Deinococcus cellulosilyticus]GEM46773.1 ABC transporter substrate-binding protein [Deinococcus cellulosilyticus NBRC 106333 = KACC 11606]